jgi:hypothetical protein
MDLGMPERLLRETLMCLCRGFTFKTSIRKMYTLASLFFLSLFVLLNVIIRIIARAAYIRNNLYRAHDALLGLLSSCRDRCFFLTRFLP